jgi:hypothetical protein
VVGDLFFDEAVSTSVVNRWEITQIVQVTAPRTIKVRCVYDEDGTPAGAGQPVPCQGAICSVTDDLSLAIIPSTGYAQLSETIKSAIQNINWIFISKNFKQVDGLPFSEGQNAPKLVAVDDLDLGDSADFQPATNQDVVFRIPSGFKTGVNIVGRFFITNAQASNGVKLILTYRIVTPGDNPNGGIQRTATKIINPLPTEDEIAWVDFFTIPAAFIPHTTSWVNCRLTRAGLDSEDGYPGDFMLLSILVRKL